MGGGNGSRCGDDRLRADINQKLIVAKKSRRDVRPTRKVIQEAVATISSDGQSLTFKDFQKVVSRLGMTAIPEKQLRAVFARFEQDQGVVVFGDMIDFLCPEEGHP